MISEMLRHPIAFWRDHRLAQTHASAFVDGELDGHQADRIAAHRRACPPCHRLLDTLHRTVLALRRLHDTEARPDLGESILQRLRSPDR